MYFGRNDDGFTTRKIRGIKIVDNKLNKRVSDIFNTRDEIAFDNRNYYNENKERTKQVVEERINDKLRNISPYIGGQKNPDYKPQTQIINNSLGENKKFNLSQSNFDQSKSNSENQAKKKFEGVTKMKHNFQKFQNNNQEENNVNTSYTYKNSKTHREDNNLNKTVQYENVNFKDRSLSPITHKRNQHVESFKTMVNEPGSTDDVKNITYFEEFNKKNNEMLYNKIREKSEQRIELSKKAGERLLRSPNKTPKEKLQEGTHGVLEEKFTKDYIREKAMIKTMQMEEIRNKIKFRDEKRSEIYDYWEMNNKLINKSTDRVNNKSSYDQDQAFFKSYKDLSIKVMNNDKMKQTDRKFNNTASKEGIKKVTEFCKMSRDLSKILLKKNIIAQEQANDKKLIRSKSTIHGRNLFNIKDY